MRLPHPAALVVALALLARTLPAPAAEQHPWPTCANFRNQHDAQITYHADQSDPLGLAASPPDTTVPCGGNVAFGTPPLISCAVLDPRPNAQSALQLLYAYTRADSDPYGLDPDGNSIACDQNTDGQGATPQSVDRSQAATPLPGTGNVNETLSRTTTSTPVTLPLATPASGVSAGSKSGTPFGAILANDATPGTSSGVEGAKGRVPSLTAPAAGTTDLGTSGGGTTSGTGTAGSTAGGPGTSGSSPGGTGKSSRSTSGTGKTGSGTASGTSKRGTGTTGGTGKSGGGNTGGTGTPTTHGGTGHQPSAHTPSRHAKGHGKHHPSPAKGSHHHRGHHHSHPKGNHHHHGGHHKKH